MAKKTAKEKTATGANLGFEEKLWLAADKLRNNMDAAEYKHIVLGLVFLKYISDAFEEKHASLEAGRSRGTDPEDKDEYLADNVFWVPKAARWKILQDNAKRPEIGKLIDDAMFSIEKDNPPLKGVLPKDYSRPGLDKHRLGELIDMVATIGLGSKEHRSQDLLGRVYEYFLSRFASAEGKKGGQFYTPDCVVRLLVEVLAPYKGRVYDPCCGSGGMFVQSEKFIEAHGGKIGDISVYGQESNHTTWRLARMNLALRRIEGNLGPQNADSFHRDLHRDLKADYVLANPPFNDSDWRGDLLKDDARWKYGVPPSSNANFAWIQHIVHHLAPTGTAAVVLAEASLDSEPGAELDIRKALIENDLVEAIISLPDRLFYTNPNAVAFWILSRNKHTEGTRDRRGEILFIDAARLGVELNRTHQVLPDAGIEKIAKTYHAWRTSKAAPKDVPGFSCSREAKDITANNFCLLPAAYVGVEAPDARLQHAGVGDQKQLLRGALARQADVDRLWTSVLNGGLTSVSAPLKTFRLEDVLIRSDARLGNAPEPEILTCTERAGLILQRERFSKRIATEDTSAYKLVHRTDIVYNPYLLWAGAIDQCTIVDVGITSPAYEVLKVREGFDPTLVGFALTNPQMVKRYHGISVGTVRRRRRAPVEKFLQLEVRLPFGEEHGKITAVMNAIQSRIFLNRQVSAALKDILQNICRSMLHPKV